MNPAPPVTTTFTLLLPSVERHGVRRTATPVRSAGRVRCVCRSSPVPPTVAADQDSRGGFMTETPSARDARLGPPPLHQGSAGGAALIWAAPTITGLDARAFAVGSDAGLSDRVQTWTSATKALGQPRQSGVAVGNLPLGPATSTSSVPVDTYDFQPGNGKYLDLDGTGSSNPVSVSQVSTWRGLDVSRSRSLWRAPTPTVVSRAPTTTTRRPWKSAAFRCSTFRRVGRSVHDNEFHGHRHRWAPSSSSMTPTLSLLGRQRRACS